MDKGTTNSGIPVLGEVVKMLAAPRPSSKVGPVIGSYLKERFSIRHSLNGKFELLEIHHSPNGELMEDGKSLSLISLSDAQKPETVSKDGFAM